MDVGPLSLDFQKERHIWKNLDKAFIKRIHKQLFSTGTMRTGREKDTEQQQCECLYIT